MLIKTQELAKKELPKGATWKEVGKLYNIDPKSLFDIVKRYKKRRNIA
jgi:hypothetical protein